MGAEQSTAASAVPDSGRSKRKRGSAADDDAGNEVPEVEISSDAKKRQRAARRKSTGRNERKSLLAGAGGAIDLSDPTAFHDDISTDLADPARLAKLMTEAFSHAVGWIETRSAADDREQFQALTKKVFEEWHAKVSASHGLETATAATAVRHNPRNTEMRQTLAMYGATLDRLKAEERAWEQAIGLGAAMSHVDGVEAAAMTAKARQTKDNQAMRAEEASRQQEEQAGSLDTTIGLELKSMRSFTTQAEKLLNAVERSMKEDSDAIAATRFAGYVAINDPKKLISAVLQGPTLPTTTTATATATAAATAAGS